MNRFSELRAFTAVIDAGGFSAAARELGQSRSSVNRLVISLEARLGVQLLNRTTRSVTPTSNGQALYDRARQLLEDLDEIENAISSTSSEAIGKLKVSAPPSFGDLNFARLTAAFLTHHPKIDLEITFDARIIDPVAEGFDLVIRIAEPDEETTLVDHRILELTYIACASPQYLERRGVPEAPEDLRQHALLHLHQQNRPQKLVFEGPDGPFSIPVRAAVLSNTLDALLEAARVDLGIAILPSYAVRSDLADGRLQRVLPKHRLPSRMLQVIYPPARHLSAKVQLLTEFIRDWCKE